MPVGRCGGTEEKVRKMSTKTVSSEVSDANGESRPPTAIQHACAVTARDQLCSEIEPSIAGFVLQVQRVKVEALHGTAEWACL